MTRDELFSDTLAAPVLTTSSLSSVAANFQARGPAWAAVANGLVPERGEEIRAQLSRGSGAARLPLFTLG